MIIEFEGEFMADYIIRATAADGEVRAFASTTRDLVEEARKAHNTGGNCGTGTSSDSRRHDGFHDERRR